MYVLEPIIRLGKSCAVIILLKSQSTNFSNFSKFGNSITSRSFLPYLFKPTLIQVCTLMQVISLVERIWPGSIDSVVYGHVLRGWNCTPQFHPGVGIYLKFGLPWTGYSERHYGGDWNGSSSHI